MTGYDERQECLDAFYIRNGPCCAGCDWWRHTNSLVGECTASAPVSGKERVGMIGVVSSSLLLDAGHVLTKREHACGSFRDTFEWSSLPPAYLRRIGHP